MAIGGAAQKEAAQHHGYTGERGYHPLLAVAAGTGDVLMARLREGRAHTARGAGDFLRETIGRVREAGASGPLTMRADSGFYAHAVVAADGRALQHHRAPASSQPREPTLPNGPSILTQPLPQAEGRAAASAERATRTSISV